MKKFILLVILLFIIPFYSHAVFIIGSGAVGGGGGGSISDDFSSDTSANWTSYASQTWTWNTGSDDLEYDGPLNTDDVLIHSTNLGGIKQWIRYEINTATSTNDKSLCVLRSASDGSGLKYVMGAAGSNIYVWTFSGATQSEQSTGPYYISGGWPANTVFGWAVENTGTSTKFSIWVNPSSGDPGTWGAAQNTWCASGCSDTLGFTAWADSGTYVGLSAEDGTESFDFFEAGTW